MPGFRRHGDPAAYIGTLLRDGVHENNADTDNVGIGGLDLYDRHDDPALQSLAVGQIITQIYTVTIDDLHGGTITQDVTVTITGTDDAPTIVKVATTGVRRR